MSSQKWTRAKIDPALEVPIIADGAIAGPVADGRLVPVLVVFAETRPQLAELFRVHRHIRTGDVQSQWARSRHHPDDVMLLLGFERPMEVEFLLRFSIVRQALLIEAILSAGAAYLQPGSPGDRISSRLDDENVLIEIPDAGFRDFWDRELFKAMTREMARRLGVSKRKAEPAARRHIAELREFSRFRLPPSATNADAQSPPQTDLDSDG